MDQTGFEGIKDSSSTLSGSSSEESDHHQAHKPGETALPGRFYECMYCKRGFTNAQALGGHMNIHRKDKAKAKQQKAAAAVAARQPARKSCEDQRFYDVGKTTAAALLGDHHQQTKYYEVPVAGGQMSYQHFFPGSNPSYNLYDLVAPGRENLGLFRDYEDLNLSKQVGHSTSTDQKDLGEIENNTTWNEDSEVDLELRLGLAL